MEDELVFGLERRSGAESRPERLCVECHIVENVVVSGEETLERQGQAYSDIRRLESGQLGNVAHHAGTTLYFHSDARIDVYGRLLSEGTADEEVTLRCDRTDWMFDYLPYDMVSGQWRGIRFHGSSYGNKLTFTDVHGTFDGIVCDSSDVSQMK